MRDPGSRFVPVEELQRRWRNAPGADAARMRAEADEFYGDEDRIGDADDPWDTVNSALAKVAKRRSRALALAELREMGAQGDFDALLDKRVYRR